MYQVVRKLNENTYEGFNIYEDKELAELEVKTIKAFLGYDTEIIELGG